MCLAIPGKLLEVVTEESNWKTGRVSFGGIVKEVNLTYVPEARVGDYVIVHVGFAISKVEASEARKVFDYLKEMEGVEELTEVDPEVS